MLKRSLPTEDQDARWGAEIREYAKVILDMAKVVAPVSFTEFVPLALEG